MPESSASEIVGVAGTKEFMNRQWIIRGRDVGYYALLEGEILKMRGDPLTRLVGVCDEFRGDAVVINNLAKALATNFRGWATVSYSDYLEFHSSPYGEAFQIWYAIRDQDPEMTVRKIHFWMMELAAESPALFHKTRTEIMDAIDLASGHTPLKN